MPFDIGFWHAFSERAREKDLLASVQLVSPEQLKEDWAKGRGIVSAVQGESIIHGKPVTLRIGLGQNFPIGLPIIFLVPWDVLGFLPHVDIDGYVCFAQEEGLLLNRRDPLDIAEEALKRAIRVLSDGFEGSNYSDLVDEFESYWVRLKEKESLPSFIRPDDVTRKISVALSEKSYEFVCDGEQAVSEYLNGNRPKHRTIRAGLYIPLRPGFLITPPQGGSFWDIEKVRQIVNSGIMPEGVRVLERLSRKWKSEELVLFRLPRPSGGATLFGIRFEGVSGGHPLRKEGKVQRLIPVALVRRDRQYLIPRGGGKMELENKRVALIGCGSVGGYIALEIARAGVSDLTLIDHDTLSEENIFRHVLGRSALQKSKVDALKKEIEDKIPFTKVTPVPKHIEVAIDEGQLDLTRFDLLMVALGKPTMELYLNEIIHGTKGSPPVVFTWLEPYGIGGHAMLTNNSREGAKVPGCLECLFTPAVGDPNSSLHNRSSFAEGGQSFGKNISGCAGLFTPYGSLDAMRTAELATRLAIDALERTVQGNPLLSWKGSKAEFVKAGFLVSSRCDLSEDELHATRYEYVNPKCSVCGNPLRNSKGNSN